MLFIYDIFPNLLLNFNEATIISNRPAWSAQNLKQNWKLRSMNRGKNLHVYK